MANHSPSPPPAQYTPTTEDRAEFDRAFNDLFDQISPEHVVPFTEHLWALRCDVHTAISEALRSVVEESEVSLLSRASIAYWIFTNYPSVPASVVSDAMGGLALSVHQRIRLDCLRRTAGMFAEYDIAALRSLPYAEYLQTDHWLNLRDLAIERAAGCCQVCKASGNLNVHHNTYQRRGEEAPSDLIVLCSDCHQLFHESGKVVG